MSEFLEPCKCGRPGCNELVPAVRGKRKYATDECSHYAKLKRERERKRKELKMVRDLLPEKKFQNIQPPNSIAKNVVSIENTE